MERDSIAVIVLNWNNAGDTLECVASLLGAKGAGNNILVVDNGSTDDSVSLISTASPHLRILTTDCNLGYAGGNNVGIRHALAGGADYVCILNNDVVVAPDFLEPLLAAFRQGPDIGIVTPLIAENDERGRIWALGSSVDRKTGEVRRRHAGEAVETWRSRPAIEVDTASGAAMFVRREVFERIGLIDERYFLYYEETDWCLCARKAGYRILAVPQSMVWHKVSASLGTASPRVDYYMLRNQFRLIARHWRGASRVRAQGAALVRGVLTIAAYTLKSHGGQRKPSRNARLLALRDAALRRWGPMGPDVEHACRAQQ